MTKFKVGDKVRVKANIKAGQRFGMDCDDARYATCMVTSEMAAKAGNLVTISGVRDYGDHHRYSIKEDCWSWVDGMFEGLATNKIVITTDGKTTTARLFDGMKLIRKAEAKCSPDDTFDFMVGAKLAMERLEEKKPVNPFKVGYYVRVTGENSHGHCLPFGSVGRVAKVDSESCYVDGFSTYGARVDQWVAVRELEKI